MLIPQIIGVLSLYHCTKYYAPSIYANIKNITFYVFGVTLSTDLNIGFNCSEWFKLYVGFNYSLKNK